MSVPSFDDYGKKNKDLLGGYCFKNSLLFNSCTSPGLSLATGLKSQNGYVQINHKSSDGNFSSKWKLNTSGSVDTELNFLNVSTGMNVKLNHESPVGSVLSMGTSMVEAKYREENFTSTLGLLFQDRVPTVLTATHSLGSKDQGNVFVGCGIEVDLRNDREDIKDFNVGVEYTNKDFTATFRSYEYGEALDLSWISKLSCGMTIGSKVELSPEDETTMTFGLNKHFKDLSLNAKLNTEGTLSTKLERHLRDPRVKVVTTAEMSPLKSLFPTKFGVKLDFGDF